MRIFNRMGMGWDENFKSLGWDGIKISKVWDGMGWDGTFSLDGMGMGSSVKKKL